MGYDGQVMLVKVKFEKGAVGTPHAHYHTQTTYVASGKFEFDIEGKKKLCQRAMVYISSLMRYMDVYVLNQEYL